MSGYTNAITNITDESQYYVYPMAASLRGGAVESEYNIRNLMTCLFNKSAAKRDEDFILYYNKVINGQRPTLETYYDNANWYRINFDNKYCELFDLVVGPGEGNCNGYYTRLYDYTPINNTALDISKLMDTEAGFTPLLPIDLAPTQPVAKKFYDSLKKLKDTDGSISSDNADFGAEYVLNGSYVDGTSVRVKLNESDDSPYIYYIKINGTWTLSSDIVTIYTKDDEGQKVNKYRIYADGKYFYKDSTDKNKNPIKATFINAEGIDIAHTDTTNNNARYIELPGTCTLYKIATTYQDFNVVLGLNWTTNQLVSSAQITICEDTTPIKYVTETDLDGDTTQYAYTEFGLLNKNMQDHGLLDAGIVLGTIHIKKTPVYVYQNNSSEYRFEYSCTYEGNRYKTACINLDKLGTDTDNLGENMYDKINRLFSLMIDNGSFKIGTVIKNSGFDSNPDSAEHNFVKGIAPYRLDLGISDFEQGVGQNYINGYLRFINYNEQTNNASEVKDGYIFKCRLQVSPDTGEPIGLESLTLFNDGIECFDTSINFNQDVYIGNRSANTKCSLVVTDTIDADGIIRANSSLQINSDGVLRFGGNGPELKVVRGNLYTINFDTDNLKVTNATVSNSLTVKNTFKVDTTKLDLDSSTGEITTMGKIETSNNIKGNEITGNKVFGAVWM